MNVFSNRLILLAALTIIAVFTACFHTQLLDVATSILHSGIELQRDFNRNLAHHLHATKNGDSPDSLWIALGLAFTYGVVHALGPGHGKFVVMTYFLSHQRRIWRGFLMGTQIAVLHVISAIIIVLIAHYLAERFWGPTGDMPALRTASYASIALVGLYMLRRALRHARHGRSDECGHDHGHTHSQDAGRQGLLSLGVGIAPCSGAVLLLIYAFANDLVPLGILMVGAIAAGMAITMIGLGLASILARHLMMRRMMAKNEAKASRIGAVVELLGAVFIILFGAAMTVTSVML